MNQLINKIEKLRRKVVQIIFGQQTYILNDIEKLALLNWNPIPTQAGIANNIRIHKIISTKKSRHKFTLYTENLTSEQRKKNTLIQDSDQVKIIIKSH